MTLLLLHPCGAPDEPILIKNRHYNIFKECNEFSVTAKFTKTVEMNLGKRTTCCGVISCLCSHSVERS